MTTGFVDEAAIDSLVQTVYEDAMLVARDNNLATSLVTVFNDRTGVAPRQNFAYGTATLQTVAEDDDLVSQTFTPSADQTLTPAEAAAQFFLTDLRMETDMFQVRTEAAMELGMATASKIDVDIFSDIPSLTGGSVGTSGSVCTWAYFMAMEALLRIQNAPRPWVFVCTPAQWNSLAQAASIAGTRTNAPDGLLASVAANYYVTSYNGVAIFVTQNLPTSSTDAYAGMFSRNAMAYDNRRAPRLEPERDASRRGIELNMSTVYAHGIWRPQYGVLGLFDNNAPDGT
jgi:hypothetical protein